MLVIYTVPGCTNCRKIKNYLKEHEINYLEKNLFKALLNASEIKYLISRLGKGIDDLINTNSSILKDNKINLSKLTNDEVIKFITNNPNIVNRPIIFEENISNNSNNNSESIVDELKKHLKCDISCPHYQTCGGLRNE